MEGKFADLINDVHQQSNFIPRLEAPRNIDDFPDK